MCVLVQKFGGTSVESKESRIHVIRHIQEALEDGFKVIAVVSALGRKPSPYATDTLLSLVDYPNSNITDWELDLLMSCGETIAAVVLANELRKQSILATALTGMQAGIITTKEFNRAKIKTVKPVRVLKELENNDVIVVAGFQGQTNEGDITTIGRGGSDTTAAALGVALNVEKIEIFTDVNGIMTADPRVVESAQSLNHVTYTEICNLAYQGAKIIHPRAVEIAMQGNIPVHIRPTFSNEQGTLITSSVLTESGTHVSDRLITGITHIDDISQVKVHLTEDTHHLQSDVFKSMAEAGISVDFINISPMVVVYTIPTTMTEKAVSILRSLDLKPIITKNCAKVSAVGAGMAGVPGVASKIVQALTNENIKILQSADSHTTIWVLVHDKDVKKAVNALHETFDLGKKE